MCQRVVYSSGGLGRDGGTRHVQSVAWCSVTHRPRCFLGSGRELPPSNIKLKCPELASLWESTSPSWWPHQWHSPEESTRGAFTTFTDTKRRTQGVDAWTEYGAFPPEHPDSHHRPWCTVSIIPEEWGEWGAIWGGVFLCILKTLSGGSAARSQVPAQPREMPGVGMPPCGRPCETTQPVLWHCAVVTTVMIDLQIDVLNLERSRCFVLVFHCSLVRPAIESCGPERDQKEHWFSPNQDCA